MPPKSRSGTKNQISFDASQMVTLISNEGHEFFVDKRCIVCSTTLKEKLHEGETNIVLDNIDTESLEKVCGGNNNHYNFFFQIIEYFYYKLRYDHEPENRPEFVIKPSLALKLAVAAHALKT